MCINRLSFLEVKNTSHLFLLPKDNVYGLIFSIDVTYSASEVWALSEEVFSVSDGKPIQETNLPKSYLV